MILALWLGLAGMHSAPVAELVDAPDSKSGFLTEVGVRVSLGAPYSRTMTIYSKFDPKSQDIYATWKKDLVRYADLDPNGHVNNGALNQFFEDGRVNFRFELMPFLADRIFVGFALGKFSATYYAGLTYPAEINIGTVVTRIGNASFDLAQALFDGEICIASARVTQIYFDPDTGKSIALPKNIRTALEGVLVQV